MKGEEVAYTFDPQILLSTPDLWASIMFDHEIPDFHSWLWRYLTADDIRYLVLLLPAGCGKTQLVSIEHTIFEICRDPDTRIALIQKQLPQGMRVVEAIQRQLIYNDKLNALYGPFRSHEDGYPWSNTTFRVAGNKDTAQTTNTVHTFGVETTAVLGYRFKLVKPDDVCTDDNSTTPEGRDKLETKLTTEWDKTMVGTKNPRLIMPGTAFAFDDLYLSKMREEVCSCYIGPSDWRDPEELSAEEKSRYVVIRKDAYVGMTGGLLWPKQWPQERLDFEKVKSKRNHDRRIRNIVQDPTEAIFLEAAIEGDDNLDYPGCLDKERKVGEYDPSWRIIAGCDPSSGKKTGAAAQFAHIVVGLDEEGVMHVIDLFTAPINMTKSGDASGHNDKLSQIGTIIARARRYNAAFTVIEDNSQQYAWISTTRDKAKDVRVKPHNTNKNKMHPELGVESMADMIEAGRLRIPYGSQTSRRTMDPLIEQLTRYPHGNLTDCVMALWFAYYWSRKRGKASIVDFQSLINRATTLGSKK